MIIQYIVEIHNIKIVKTEISIQMKINIQNQHLNNSLPAKV